MRNVREILRLRWGLGFSIRQIARSCSASHSTVCELLDRAEKAGLSWPLSEQMDDALEAKLYRVACHGKDKKPLPDMEYIHKELRRKGVTLWEEYKQAHPDGYQRSQFCQLYRNWAKTVDVSMRQTHVAGEKMFVDYAGQTIPVLDPSTGQIRDAVLFIAVLGSSNYTYAEPSWDQRLESWIGAHVRAFEFFGGVPRVIVPDNLKSGVRQPDYYEPDLNPTYQEMASHYNAMVIPARLRHPRDKAKAEAGVQVAERWILARLRNRTFFGLGELSEAVQEVLVDLNNRPFQKMDGCRRSYFENVDMVLFKGRRVASHKRLRGKGNCSTLKEHMPASHRRYLEWTPSRILSWARSVGPATAELVQTILGQETSPRTRLQVLPRHLTADQRVQQPARRGCLR